MLFVAKKRYPSERSNYLSYSHQTLAVVDRKSRKNYHHSVDSKIKRTIDIIGAIVGLLVTVIIYLPIAIGMITSGVTSEDAYKTARSICCIMGEYFQIQDDYLDCFGSPEVIGKVGTDIQDNKCSWLVVQALLKATPAQRRILEQNYGKWDDKKVEKVKKVYREMELPKAFETYEEESYQQIQAELDKVTLMPRDVFELLLKKIYKRNK